MTAVDTALYPDEVLIGTANGPGLWLAPAGTAAPADFGEYTSPWVNLGYASDDGVTISGDTTTEAITPWQSKLPIRTIVTEVTRTINFTMWQLNADTLGLYFDTDVAEDDPGEYSFDVRSDAPPKIYAVSVDVKDGENRFRLTYSRANIDSTGDMAITKSAVVPLEVTLSALDDNGTMVHVDVKSGESGSGAAVSAVNPNSGDAAGGEVVTITGTNFTGATGATFGGTPGTTFSVTNETTIAVTTPAHAAGAVAVVVQSPRGNGTLANGFTYEAA